MNLLNMSISGKFLSCTLILIYTASVTACGSRNGDTSIGREEPAVNVQIPAFNADSAYSYVEAQVRFGPRVPNTKAHKDCGDYLASELERLGAKVYNQYADLVAYDGTLLKARNIIGEYNPDARKRVILFAHWDSRPYADNGEERHHHTPIDGANDGASGVGVLLEIARQLQMQSPETGVDIAFFDAEDYGIPEFYQGRYKPDTWCLGSQYWGRIPHIPNYKARYGILLDMVGGRNATFHYEGYSQRTAGNVMKKIWNAAHKIGYGNMFIKDNGGEITDDHIYVNRYRQIPCVDIIHYDADSDTGFNPTWHTIDDNMENIDRATLQAVGQTVLQVIYNEK